MTYNINKHKPDPNYLRSVITSKGRSINNASLQLGISERTLHRYLQSPEQPGYIECPYTVQYAIESMSAINQC